ncbi:hypothetical protein QBC43DRAFT_291990 [Cladorrhinum sp. PSN259]|nr:hypothetical protein QBC43DRAFT_291990 [Cladorrhinum sp. PSN259]
MARGQDFDGKEIFIIANLTIFSRSQPTLDLAKSEIQSCLRNPKTQRVRTHAADMGDPVLADKALASFLPTLPDTLILVAGGTPDDLGFLASSDLTRSNFESSMKNNYYSSLYPSRQS